MIVSEHDDGDDEGTRPEEGFDDGTKDGRSDVGCNVGPALIEGDDVKATNSVRTSTEDCSLEEKDTPQCNR